MGAPGAKAKADKHPKRTYKTCKMDLKRQRERIDSALCRQPNDPVGDQIRKVEPLKKVRRPFLNSPLD